MMYCDEVIAEVWQNRDAYTARNHNSLAEILADLRELQKRPDCKIVDRRDLSGIQAQIPRYRETITQSHDLPA